jgi:nicotinate-nucleotide adenylyltransferase
MEIALFGTSADPPTYAHARILEYLCEHYDRVAIWAANNPFKSNQTPLCHRHQMLQLLINHCLINYCQLARAHPGDRLELHPELSHPRTWHTLNQAQARWPDAQFTLVIGADILPQIITWYQAADLLRQVKLLVIPRPGYPIRPTDCAPLEAMTIAITIANLATPAIASSDYRPQPNRKPDLIPPNVQAYIDREQLYPWPANPVSKPSAPKPSAPKKTVQSSRRI